MIQLKEVPLNTHIALCREASMSAMSIGIGLTHIRRYDFSQTGFFYSGMHSYATGIERLLKLIVIYEHRLANSDAFPSNAQLKSYSHGIKDLLEFAKNTASVRLSEYQVFDISNDAIFEKVIEYITDFAYQARYYNLDYISGKIQKNDEPLKRWDSEICPEIIKRHHKNSKRKSTLMKTIAKELDPITFVSHHSDQGHQISNLQDLFQLGELSPTKQKYSMYYLYRIANFLSDILTHLERVVRYFPTLRDFFVIYRIDDSKHILRKTSWNPMPPYKF
ncbi:hypothetical protein ACK30K_07990 [Aeromonas caviae]